MMDRFTVGGVMGTGFSVWFKNLVPFTLIAVLLHAPVLIYTGVVFNGGLDSLETLTRWSLIVVVGSFVLQTLTAAAVTYGVVMQLQGSHAGIGACLGKGLARLLPVLGVAIVSGICIILGLVLLIVPGLIIATIVYVATPAAVIEKSGVFGALSRSSELTRGHRMQIFAIMLLLWLIGVGVNQVEQSMFLEHASMSDIKTYVYVNLGAQILLSTLGAVMTAVGYSVLRREKDGTSVDELAAVFA
jgi:hypothetical protein